MNNLINSFKGAGAERGKVFPGEWYERFPRQSFSGQQIRYSFLDKFGDLHAAVLARFLP